MNPLGDPEQIHALANRFDRNSIAIRAIGARVAHRLETASWQCTKANRFRAECRAVNAEARQRADALHAIAVDLHRHAEWVRQTTADLMGLEKRIKDWFDKNRGIWQAWPIKIDFPGAGDPAWRAVQDQLKKLGVAI
ncbi:MAG: WXG100 family type VII secretion target [Microthrixaceae bacterium]